MPATVERITPQNAQRDLRDNFGTLFVCAYDSEEKWRANRLEGAIPLSELLVREASLPKDREIIFYCA